MARHDESGEARRRADPPCSPPAAGDAHGAEGERFGDFARRGERFADRATQTWAQARANRERPGAR